jgi:hypothetical protein
MYKVKVTSPLGVKIYEFETLKEALRFIERMKGSPGVIVERLW